MSDHINSTVSPARLRANRRNARKSTGPRTAEGKTVSSRNALVHGLYCARNILLPGESQAQFLLLRQSFIRSLLPVDAIELVLVERMVISQWKLDRLHALEQEQHEETIERIEHSSRYWIQELEKKSQGKTAKTWPMLDNEMKQNPPPWNQRLSLEQSCSRGQELIDAIRSGSIAPEEVQAIMLDKPEELDRQEKLSRIEQRLEASFDKALRELDRLRKARSRGKKKEQETESCPYLEDVEPIQQMLEQEEQQEIAAPPAACPASDFDELSRVAGYGMAPNIEQTERNEATEIEASVNSNAEKGLATDGLRRAQSSRAPMNTDEREEDDGIERNEFGEPVKQRRADDCFS